MIYQILRKQYMVLRHSGKGMSHEQIINYINDQLNFPVIEQESFEVIDHEDNSMMEISAEKIGGALKQITDVIII